MIEAYEIAGCVWYQKF